MIGKAWALEAIEALADVRGKPEGQQRPRTVAREHPIEVVGAIGQAVAQEDGGVGAGHGRVPGLVAKMAIGGFVALAGSQARV